MIYLDKLNKETIYYQSKEVNGFGFPSSLIEEDNCVLTQNKELLDELITNNIDVTLLSDKLNLPDCYTLYDIFSFYFAGKVNNDIDMIQAIFNGILNDSDYCFCMKIGSSFSWFVFKDNRIIKINKLQFSFAMSKYSVGNFIKQLNYKIAQSEINLKKVIYLIWDYSDIDNEFNTYIKNYKLLSEVFTDIRGIDGLSCLDTYKLLSNNIDFNIALNADKFVDVLNNNMSDLRLNYFENRFTYNNIFLKDYSSEVCSNIVYAKSEFFIVMDCEGVKNSDGDLRNGLDELGGLICCIYNNRVISNESFSCDIILMKETLKIAFNNYKKLSKKSVINILVYGSSDEKMFYNSYKSSLKFKLKFIDCKPFIKRYLMNNNLVLDSKQTLSNIARHLYVKPIFPKHNPLCDARTLFNILTKIYYKTKEFPI